MKTLNLFIGTIILGFAAFLFSVLVYAVAKLSGMTNPDFFVEIVDSLVIGLFSATILIDYTKGENK